jgi:hypothetical protein
MMPPLKRLLMSPSEVPARENSSTISFTTTLASAMGKENAKIDMSDESVTAFAMESPRGALFTAFTPSAWP